jgi:hypothetical protein
MYGVDIKPHAEKGFVQVYVRYGGSRIDTLAIPPQQSSGPPSTILCRPAAGGLTFFRNPYVSQVFNAPAPGARIAMAGTGAYRIALVRATGDTTLVVEKQHQPAPITDAEWESVVRPHGEWSTRNPGVKCTPVEFTRPAGKPAFRTIFFDDAERMWVEVVTADGHRFDVFDADGVQLGNLRSPGRLESVPPYVRGDRLYLVTTDSLDVQSVKVFRVER